MTFERYAAAWTVGEFARSIEGSPIDVLGALLQPQAAALPPHIQSVFMQNALKIFAFIVAAAYNVLPTLEDEDQDQESFEDITPETIDQANNMLTQALDVFTQSVHLEVQERACFALEILKLYSTLRASSSNEDIAAELAALFDGTLNPVAKGAQRKVVVPEGVDLDSQINALDEEDENPFEEEEEEYVKPAHSESDEDRSAASGSEDFAPTPTRRSAAAEKARNIELRLQREANNPYMLGSRSSSTRKSMLGDDFTSSPPVATLSSSDLGMGLVVGNKNQSAPKKKRGGKVFKVKRDEDAPGGGADDDEAVEDNKGVSDALSSINLDDPLKADEILPIARHRTDIEKDKKVSPIPSSPSCFSLPFLLCCQLSNLFIRYWRLRQQPKIRHAAGAREKESDPAERDEMSAAVVIERTRRARRVRRVRRARRARSVLETALVAPRHKRRANSLILG